MTHYRETKYGFDYGAAKVTRMLSDEKRGWIALGIETPKHKIPIQIYVTKTGKVRIFSEGEEWVIESREKTKMKKHTSKAYKGLK